MGANDEAGVGLASHATYPSSVAQRTLRRQTPKVGAECPNRARPVLCGGRSEMSVPTANATQLADSEWISSQLSRSFAFSALELAMLSCACAIARQMSRWKRA